jgi:hypothetical protein
MVREIPPTSTSAREPSIDFTFAGIATHIKTFQFSPQRHRGHRVEFISKKKKKIVGPFLNFLA